MAYYPYATQFTARYQLISPAGIAAVFNDPLDLNYVGMLTEVSGLDSAEVRESADDLVEADGGVHGNFYFGRRPIILNGKVFGHATIQARDVRLDLARRASLALRGDSVLSWKPATRYENFVINPKFGTASGTATGWTLVTPTGGTMGTTGTAAMPDNGAKFGYHVRFTNAADTTLRAPGIISDYIAINPGSTYNSAADAYIVDNASGTTNGPTITIQWFTNNTGTAASTPTVAATVDDPTLSTRVRPSVSGVAPTDARYCRILLTQPTNVSSDVVDTYWTNVVLTNSASTAFIDPATAGYYWQGNADGSASADFVEMYTTVRRQQPFRESGQWVKDFQIPLVSEYAVFFSTTQKTTSSSAENRGSYPAYPIFAITGAASSPTVTVTTPSGGTQVFVTTGLSLGAGETVEFDMLNHTGVFTAGGRIGQSANRYIDFSTAVFGSFNTGTSTVAVSGGTLVARWRDTWA